VRDPKIEFLGGKKSFFQLVSSQDNLFWIFQNIHSSNRSVELSHTHTHTHTHTNIYAVACTYTQAYSYKQCFNSSCFSVHSFKIKSGVDKLDGMVDDTSFKKKKKIFFYNRAILKGLTHRKCVFDICVGMLWFIFVYLTRNGLNASEDFLNVHLFMTTPGR